MRFLAGVIERVRPRAARISTNARANSGPFPSSSCLKYTNTSSQASPCAAIGFGPALEIGRLVALVAQPEVAVARRRAHRRRLVAEVGDAERHAVRRERGDTPRPSSHESCRNSNAGPQIRRQPFQERLEPSTVALEVGGNWNRSGPRCGPSTRALSQKNSHVSSRVLEPLDVRDALRRFQRVREALGRLLAASRRSSSCVGMR